MLRSGRASRTAQFVNIRTQLVHGCAVTLFLSVPDARPERSAATFPSCNFPGLLFANHDATKPYKFIGFGAMDATKPYKFIGFGAMYSRWPLYLLQVPGTIGSHTRLHLGTRRMVLHRMVPKDKSQNSSSVWGRSGLLLLGNPSGKVGGFAPHLS